VLSQRLVHPFRPDCLTGTVVDSGAIREDGESTFEVRKAGGSAFVVPCSFPHIGTAISVPLMYLPYLPAVESHVMGECLQSRGKHLLEYLCIDLWLVFEALLRHVLFLQESYLRGESV
jgi:hypothetical protein